MNSSPPRSELTKSDSLAPGTCVGERYVIVRAIGRGGMGQVYEARHARLGRRVALKLLRADVGSDDVRDRFAREARAAAQIENEHVVSVFDFESEGEHGPYLVMEYLQGTDLRCVLREQGTLAAPRAARLMHDACLGVEAAHAQRVIHRDIKPENLFVIRRSGGETCKVLDFGLAKLRAFGPSDLSTAAGAPLGTLHYMSPEQARGESDVDERTDVYACSAVLYEMLTGQRPHSAESAHALLYKITHETPRRVEEHCAWIPRGLADAVHRGLECDRAHRLASVQALRQSLEPFLGLTMAGSASHRSAPFTSDTQPAGHAPNPQPVARWARSARARQLSGILLGALALTALARFLSSAGGAADDVPPSVAEAVLPERLPQPGFAAATLPIPHAQTANAPRASTAPTPTRSAASPRAQTTRVQVARPVPSVADSAAPPAPAFERKNPYD